MAKQHGIYVNEIDTSIATPEQGKSGLQVVFGTAPINLVEDPEAATNKLVIAYTFAEAAAQLGYSGNYKNYTLCQAMDAAFRVFNVAPVIFCNVLDAKKHKKKVENVEVSVAGLQAVIEEEGILMESITVKAGETPLNYPDDYITAFDSNGYVVITLTGTKDSITVTYDQLDPTMVTESDIIGGYDSSAGTETGMELVRQVYPVFNMTPGLLLAPGWSHKPSVAAVLQAKCIEINGAFTCECVIDIDTEMARKYTDVKDVKDSSGISDSHAIAVWPKVTAAGKEFYYSALYAALVAYTDAVNDDTPHMSPSNKANKITGTVLEGGEEVNLDRLQANVLNGGGIVTAINMNGWRSWGNNTAAYPGTKDPKDAWICCRRFFSWYRNSFILTYQEKVDDPANYRLVESVVDAENIRANSLVPEKCAGLEVEYREDENPIENIIAGEVRFRVKLAPYTPAEVITADLEFSPDLLKAAMSGGE